MDEKLSRELEDHFDPTDEFLPAIEEAIQIENDPNAKFYTSAEELFAALHARLMMSTTQHGFSKAISVPSNVDFHKVKSMT